MGRTYKLCVAIFDFSGMMIEHRTWNYGAGGLLGEQDWADVHTLPLNARECHSVVGEPLSCRFLPKLDVPMLFMLVR